MRKMLIILLIVILLSAFAVMMVNGISIGNFKVYSVREIIDDNNDLDDKISELDTSIKTSYASAQTELNSSVEKLKSTKQRYQDTINYSTEDEIKSANQTEKYEISFIWTKIGFYATKNDVTMKADVSTGSVQGLYNIAFTAIGEYLQVSEFIYAIENDSKLGFKIEDFTLLPHENTKLQATFSIRNVSIDENSLTGMINQNQTSNPNNVQAGQNQETGASQ